MRERECREGKREREWIREREKKDGGDGNRERKREMLGIEKRERGGERDSGEGRRRKREKVG